MAKKSGQTAGCGASYPQSTHMPHAVKYEQNITKVYRLGYGSKYGTWQSPKPVLPHKATLRFLKEYLSGLSHLHLLTCAYVDIWPRLHSSTNSIHGPPGYRIGCWWKLFQLLCFKTASFLKQQKSNSCLISGRLDRFLGQRLASSNTPFLTTLKLMEWA